MRCTGALLLVALVGACGGAGARESAASPDTTPVSGLRSGADLTPPPQGRFIVQYAPSTPAFVPYRDRLVTGRFLDTLAASLNQSLAVPHDVLLATAHCGEPNASYEPDIRRVTLCYELIEALQQSYAGQEGGEYVVTGTLVFALMHELGHALVDVLDLPVTGREEDAVDQLATLLLLEQGPAGDSLLSGVAAWLALMAEADELDDLSFASDHGIGQQRVYNLICWIYGRDPNRYPEIRDEGWLPASRRDRCPAEYRRLRDSWQRLLAPHRRVPSRGDR